MLLGQIQSFLHLFIYPEFFLPGRDKEALPLFSFHWSDSLPKLLCKLEHLGPPLHIRLGDVTTYK